MKIIEFTVGTKTTHFNINEHKQSIRYPGIILNIDEIIDMNWYPGSTSEYVARGKISDGGHQAGTSSEYQYLEYRYPGNTSQSLGLGKVAVGTNGTALNANILGTLATPLYVDTRNSSEYMNSAMETFLDKGLMDG